MYHALFQLLTTYGFTHFLNSKYLHSIRDDNFLWSKSVMIQNFKCNDGYIYNSVWKRLTPGVMYLGIKSVIITPESVILGIHAVCTDGPPILYVCHTISVNCRMDSRFYLGKKKHTQATAKCCTSVLLFLPVVWWKVFDEQEKRSMPKYAVGQLWKLK